MLKAARVEFAAATDIGKVRSENQDRWLADVDLGLFAIADGLGGHAAGSLAAQLVVDVLPRLVRRALAGSGQTTAEAIGPALARQIKTLSEMVYNETRGQPGVSGTGTTLVLALVDGARATIVHAGDSRAYLFQDGWLRRLTRDHTLAELLAAQGQALDADVEQHPAGHKLTRYIGMPGTIMADWQALALAVGDLLLLCSDGLYGQVDEGEIIRILQSQRSIEQKSEALVAAANGAGGQDNVTVLLLSPTEKG
jgi:serine/threonine protein phosphatase PrpC